MKKITLTLGFAACFGLFSKAQWIPVTSGTSAKLDAIHFINAQKGYCAGGSVRTLATNDGGNTWTMTTSQGFRDFSFYDDNAGFGASVVGQSIAKTSNGGASWTSLTPPTSNSLWAVAATSATTAYFVGTGGVLWKTTNGGASFSVGSSGSTDLLTDIVFTNPTTGYIVVQTGKIRKTTNSGSTWTTAYTTNGLLTEMCFVNENTGYVAASNGRVLKTTDAGATWTEITVGANMSFQGVHFFDANHGMVVGLSGRAFYTNNGGNTWTEQFPGTTEHLYDVRMLSASSAIVTGENGTIIKNNAITTAVTASLEDKIPGADIVLGPNPVTDKLTIQASNTIQSVEIFDATGKQVFSADNVKGNNYTVDFSPMTTGVYLVAISGTEGKSVKKVIKK